MGNLGSMEPEQLLQLFGGSLTCAFVIFFCIIGYVLISRRGRGTGKQVRLGTAPPAESTVASRPLGMLAGGGLQGDDASSVDVDARLAGTGREAWLAEAPLRPDALASGERDTRHGREVLRLVRDPLTRQTWTQIAGMRYLSLNEIRDRAVGERVLAAITYALRFSNGAVATDQGVVMLELPPCDRVKIPTAIGALSDAPAPDDVIRLMSDPDQGQFCVHVVDRCYRRLSDVSDRETGQYMLEAITRLLQFSNGMLATNDGFGVVTVPSLKSDVHSPLPESFALSSQVAQSTGDSASLPSADLDPQLSVPSITSSTAPLSEQERFLQQLMHQTPPQSANPVERPSLMQSLRRVRQGTSSESLPSLNLADEINHIFQGKLNSASLGMVDAQVETNPDGGVRIRVGTIYYSSPDEVPDPRLRELLKLAIAEWDQS